MKNSTLILAENVEKRKVLLFYNIAIVANMVEYLCGVC
ncbi:hypothetical protein KN10_1687 [Anoxybacillus flavithermus NBRC 109594]|uniref:Uncharacterized protein n=1 Tax=Anoxybacillus flavithermus NBRC 109594 TaxID=1315967 RepID=R4FCP4_9BACL|nr:hypothetical protein KN10_1687 [Anoxybacillus flavithermus NBRC 109594]